ncbi:hypothetical protein [Halorhabdus salina]|uniref:hypothetical protein n=1 Tax=Halorhabdus salina TaxID=2750670 RepID=UPI0015EE9070|nr:hypothetical protein [Halorhabdus salina]
MRRRNLLALLGGALGAGLAGCSDVNEDDDGSAESAPTGNTAFEPDNYTVENASDLPTAEWNDSEWNDSEWNDSDWNNSDWNDSDWNDSDWNDSEWNDSDWNDSDWNDSNQTGGFTETEFELCPGTAEGIEIVNHTVGPGPNETYYVEGTVRNDGPATRCSYVLLEVIFPDERRETESMFMGDLEPGETGSFILGPIDLSDADHDPDRYNIYVTNETWDDD